MGRGIIKPKRDEDFYVEWSSIVEMPTAWGSREYMFDYGIDEARLDRADKFSTSYVDGYVSHSWDEDDIEIVDQAGTLRHSQFKEFCETLSDDGELTEASYALLGPLED